MENTKENIREKTHEDKCEERKKKVKHLSRVSEPWGGEKYYTNEWPKKERKVGKRRLGKEWKREKERSVQKNYGF